MILEKRKLETPDGNREIWVAYPKGEYDYHVKSDSVTVLLDRADRASVTEFIEKSGFAPLIDSGHTLMAFPVPRRNGWVSKGAKEQTADEKLIAALQTSIFSGTHTNGWKAIADLHFIIAEGTGATLANSLIATAPCQDLAAAALLFGGEMKDAAASNATGAAVPALIVNGKSYRDYYIASNRALKTGKNTWKCPYNDSMFVKSAKSETLTGELIQSFYRDFMKKVRRANISPAGEPDSRIDPEKEGFNYVIDCVLPDNGGLAHSWIECVPSSVRKHPDKKVPLILLSHGAGDSPLRMAEQSKFHRLGEKEGFITVYCYSSNLVSWNLTFKPGAYNDVDYYVELIKLLKEKYPIDEERIYTSGFSNGAGFAMLFAMEHPELIAASCPIDSTFPYASLGKFKPVRPSTYASVVPKPGTPKPPAFTPSSDPKAGLAPLKRALKKQKEKAYEMPVMYFYGTRESVYPISKETNQELQYRFWKDFNGIKNSPTKDELEPAVGVAGMDVKVFYPDKRYPSNAYVDNIFYADPETKKKDLYHFVLMCGKAHEVHPIDPVLGWKYVSRFRRLPDGSLKED